MVSPSSIAPAQYPLRDIPTPFIYALTQESELVTSSSVPSSRDNSNSSTSKNNEEALDVSNGVLKRKRSIEKISNNSADSSTTEIKRIKLQSDTPNDKETEDLTTTPGVGSITNNNSNDHVLLIEDIKDGLIEDTLPISPVASSGGRTPNIKPLEDSSNTEGTMLTLVQNQMADNEISKLDSLELQKIAFKFISRLNRGQLTDLNALIRDNLKRDLINTLPLEISLKILTKLKFNDIVSSLAVSKKWNKIIENTPYLWKHLLITESFVSSENFNRYIENLKTKYPYLTNFEDAYKKDFLEKNRILKNWYSPKYLPTRTTLKGHMTGVVTCLQFEDDYVITGADDKMIRVYNSKTKKFLLELGGHEGGVWALKYDTDGILVSGSTDRSVRIWDIKRGCCLFVFKGHTSTVRCLDIVEYKNTKYIVTGSRDNTLHIWRLCKDVYNPFNGDDDLKHFEYPMVYDSPDVNPYFVGVLKGHVASVRTVSGHGNIVISGSYDNTLMVWDIAQMKCLYILSGHTDRIYSTIYDHKRNKCISASMDSTVRIWDLKDIWKNGSRQTVTCAGATCTRITESFKVLNGHTALVGLLKLSHNFLISAAADGTLKGWDVNDYSLKFSYHHNNLSAITTFYMTDNILVSGSERQFNVYNLRNGNLVHSNLLRDAEQIWSVNFKDNLLVAAVEKNGQSFIEMLDFAQ